MLVNLTDVFTNEGQVQTLEVSYEADAFCTPFGNFPIIDKTPVSLKITNMGQSKVLVEGIAGFELLLVCDRCLKDLPYRFRLSFSQEVFSPDYKGGDIEDEAAEFMEGYQLNVDALVKSELLLNWPTKVLCKESCKGICTVCGKNRNEEDCSCDAFIPDPRMAAIKDIFQGNKEV